MPSSLRVCTYHSASSTITQIGFPQINIDDNVRAMDDIKYNEDINSIIINAKLVAILTTTCGSLIYYGDSDV